MASYSYLVAETAVDSTEFSDLRLRINLLKLDDFGLNSLTTAMQLKEILVTLVDNTRIVRNVNIFRF